jgi:ActR/RegA family two-component response regulator
MAHKLLFVDDEPAVLDGYRRILHRDFELDLAYTGTQALTLIQRKGPYSVIITDMRMPSMSGTQLLAEVRDRAPDTVRILLTGYAELSAAIDAINRGYIFRFLTKPCSPETLLEALTAANPEAFGRSLRITASVHIVGKFIYPSLWRLEAAASLSQLGCITLDTHLIQHAYKTSTSPPTSSSASALIPTSP